MKNALTRFIFLIEGVAIGLMIGLLMSTEQRLKVSGRLAAWVGPLAEQMPDE